MTMAVMTGEKTIELGLGDGGLADGVAVGSRAGFIGIGVALLLMLLLILLACKPWRFLSGFRSLSHRSSFQAEELERHLISDHANLVQELGNESSRIFDLEGLRLQPEEYLSSPRLEGLVHKQRIPYVSTHVNQDDNVVLDVVLDVPDDASLGQTLKCQPVTHSFEGHKHSTTEDLRPNISSGSDGDVRQHLLPKDIGDQRSCLKLEVVSGPSHGMSLSVRSSDNKRLPLILGRVPPSDMQLKDSEVSGKHAMINWNLNKLKWELIDMGSLNGTLLNSQPINNPDTKTRQSGDPVELASGDIITIGTTSNISVHITHQKECYIPFGVGMVSDPMALRRGGRKLPMEDVCYYQWPLPGQDQFGVFGVCDGHGGAAAAKSASKIIPEMIATLLSDPRNLEKVLSLCDASHILRDAFYQTETCMEHYYEGCTATVLLIWADSNNKLFAQCANVGDSACILNIEEKLIKLTEDHRVSSQSERLRMKDMGEPLKEGERRVCGLNLFRMLGDKFVKEQDKRFSSEPYISQVVHVDRTSRPFALIARFA
ncbi:hypothetical protein SAY86_030323 [Trapa natans]|uniref:protein-serine/threonine phosphatase n=1 Tax=Trapa natans TaxID=22666 RepID=A0AAN7M4V6_TRANT|nr:hypothetical protein SAY86_030323 [Trapa natans]